MTDLALALDSADDYITAMYYVAKFKEQIVATDTTAASGGAKFYSVKPGAPTVTLTLSRFHPHGCYENISPNISLLEFETLPS